MSPENLNTLRESAEVGNLSAQLQLAEMFMFGKDAPLDIQEAAHYYTLAADQGDCDAQIALAEIYLADYVIPQDSEKTKYYYTLAANQSSGYALKKLLKTDYLGSSILEENSVIVQHLIIAADKGDAEAQYLLGSLYTNDETCIYDSDLGVKYYILASEQGCIASCTDLVFEFLGEYNRPVNCEYNGRRDLEKALFYIKMAFKYFKIALQEGKPIKDRDIGGLHDNLINIYCNPKNGEFYNPKKLLQYLEELAEFDIIAQKYLFDSYEDGYLENDDCDKFYIEKDKGKAFKYLKMLELYSQKENNPIFNRLSGSILYNLAQKYDSDMSIIDERFAKNDQLALQYYEMSASKCHIEAIHILATMYAEGRIVKQDYTKATHLFLQLNDYFYYKDTIVKDSSSNLINDKSYQTYNLFANGTLYNSGELSSWVESTRLALKPFINVPIEKVAETQFRLAEHYYRTTILAHRNYKLALMYYELAANNAHKKAIFTLANLYASGQGVPQDYQKATYWFLKYYA